MARDRAWALVAIIVAANAPDLDYLPGLWVGDANAFHHGPTHSILFAVLVAAVMSLAWPHGSRANAFLWLFFAGLSHLAADVFTEDRRAPFGIPLLWPLTAETFHSPFSLFWHLRKREWAEVFQWHNVLAVGRELIITAPLILAVWMWKLTPAPVRALVRSNP